MVKIKKGNIPQEMKEKELNFNSSLVQEASDEDKKINILIRERYSLSKEISLIRKKACGIVDETEWNDYNTFVNECIAKAREENS